jgi:multidrug resistance efflux pump
MLEAMARIAPSQPNEAMVRVAQRINGTISLDPSRRVKIPEPGSLD